MKKLYNRTALFHARAIVGLFALCLLALPSPALAQAIDLKLTNVTVKEAIEALNQRENYSVAIKSAGVDMQRRVSISAQNASIDEVLAQIFADQDITYTCLLYTSSSLHLSLFTSKRTLPSTSATSTSWSLL